jgi:hypothetical protein
MIALDQVANEEQEAYIQSLIRSDCPRTQSDDSNGETSVDEKSTELNKKETEEQKMSYYHNIEKLIVVLCNKIDNLTWEVLDGESSETDVYTCADFLNMTAGAWARRYDCFLRPLDPESDMVFAEDVQANLAHFREAILGSGLQNRIKLLDGVLETEPILNAITNDIEAHLNKNEDSEFSVPLAQQLLELFNQYGILAVENLCSNLTCDLRNSSLQEFPVESDIIIVK